MSLLKSLTPSTGHPTLIKSFANFLVTKDFAYSFVKLVFRRRQVSLRLFFAVMTYERQQRNLQLIRKVFLAGDQKKVDRVETLAVSVEEETVSAFHLWKTLNFYSSHKFRFLLKIHFVLFRRFYSFFPDKFSAMRAT